MTDPILQAVKVGTLVVHVKKREWGPGRVLEIQGNRLTIYFRDASKPTLERSVTEIDLSRVPGVLEVASVQTDKALDNLPHRDGKLHLTRPPVTIADAIDAFLKHFPLGFSDPGYLGSAKTGERAYKLQARQWYVDLLDNGIGEKLLAEGNIAELVRCVAKVAGPPLNLLAPRFELAPFKQGLADPLAAKRYFGALFDVVRIGTPERHSFGRLIDAVEALPSKGASTPDTWPVLTLMPFLARPSAFMFLKPDVTKKAAEWLAYELAYQPVLNWRTYEQLLGMSRFLESELKRRLEPSMHPQDFIDVQSFLWVVSEYKSPTG